MIKGGGKSTERLEGKEFQRLHKLQEIRKKIHNMAYMYKEAETTKEGK